MKKFVCVVCGYIHEGETAPAECPVCHVGADKFTKQDRFKYNGIGFLRNAIQCYSEKELNGAWELSMTYPITNRDEMWKHLKPWNIIKNTKGQLFVIYKVNYSHNYLLWNCLESSS